jgi:1-acyl-sn-glycerol-3-phosphate acyltransferase
MAEAALNARRLAGRAQELAYGLYFALLAAVTVVPFWLLAWLAPSGAPLRRAVRAGARCFLFLSRCRLQVRGLEHLRSGGPFVLVSNHASYLDPIPLLAALPIDFGFVVKSEAWFWPIVGTFIRKLRHIPVERTDVVQSVADTERMRAALGEGRSVLVFPEGTFTRAAGIRPFRLGAFKLAAGTGRPILPISLRGTRRLLPDETWIARRSHLEVVVEPPLAAGSDDLFEMVRLRDQVAAIIARGVGEPRLDLVRAGYVPKS